MLSVTILFSACTDEPSGPIIVIDIDGNVYQTVTIGTQTWMVENLKTTHYNDGTAIPLVENNLSWSNLPTAGYCWFNNDEATYKNTYGALYNWYTVNSGKLAPTGWHVATDAEWTTLVTYVSTHFGTSVSLAKGLSSTTNWSASTNVGDIGNDLSLNNSSGFSALPGGYRNGSTGTFNDINVNGSWWSSTEYDTSYAWYRLMQYYHSYVYMNNYNKRYGLSVRCVKD